MQGIPIETSSAPVSRPHEPPAGRRRFGHPSWIAAAAALLAGCGGGGGGEANATDVSGPVVTVTGTITFDRVPTVFTAEGPRLDYSSTEQLPARGVTVEAVSGGTVQASTTTDEAGAYELAVAADQPAVLIRARTELLRSGPPSWDIRAVDNTSGNALYVLESAEFATGREDLTRNLHAASGWDGTAYTGVRSAAPFAILDVVYDAVSFVVDAAPDVALPPLVVHWSPKNVSSFGAGGAPDLVTGEIGTSLFRPGGDAGIFLLGAADSDTDEYDRHVIAHEFGHYLEWALWRSDSIGGPHTRGDQLDLRTAFSEGFGNALSAMVTGETVYVDVLGPGQAQGFAFDIEGPFFPPDPVTGAHPNPNPGWFSEESVQEILYDLYDDAIDVPEDELALGFAPILDIMTGSVRNTAALTSIFPFIAGLKEALPAEAPLIDRLVATHEIDPITDHFGSGEDNAGTPSNSSGNGLPLSPSDTGVLPIYKQIAVGETKNVCSTNDFEGGVTGAVNKLGSRAFLRFDVPSPGSHLLQARATEVPEGQISDPDMILHRVGPIAVADAEPGAECTATTQQECSESLVAVLNPGEYVLEVYEWTNTQATEGIPPIGRTCFDVSITQE